MDVDALRLFVDAARRGSFAAAARAANMAPSQVSRSVAKLESDMGVRLVQRTTRSMTLTEAGVRYLARVEGALAELDRATDEARDVSERPRGVLRLAASVAFGTTMVVPVIAGFRDRYPEVQLELVLSDDNLDLVAEGIDLAIRLAPAVAADVICTRLMDTRYRVVASADYAGGMGRVSLPGDLGSRACVLLDLPDYRSRWLFRDRAKNVVEVPVTGDVVMSSPLAVRAAMLAGLGPALLADWLVADDVAAGRCFDLFPAYEVAATTFDTAAWLIYPSRTYLPGKVRVAVDYLKEALRN